MSLMQVLSWRATYTCTANNKNSKIPCVSVCVALVLHLVYSQNDTDTKESLETETLSNDTSSQTQDGGTSTKTEDGGTSTQTQDGIRLLFIL